MRAHTRILSSSLLVAFALLPCVYAQDALARLYSASPVEPLDLSEYFPPGTGDPLRLDAVLDEALRNHPGLSAMYLGYQAQLARATEAREWPDPQLSATGFLEEVQTRTGQQEFAVGLSQKLPWFGKRELRGEAAHHLAEASMQDYRTQTLELVWQIKRAYVRLGYEHALQRLAASERAYLEDFERTASSLYVSGQRGRAGMLRSQTELARLENDLEVYPARMIALRAELNRLMGAPTDRPLATPELSSLALLELPRERLLAGALHARPELERADAEMAAQRAHEQLARKDYWPDFMVGVNYINIGDRPDHPAVPPPDEGDDAWSVMLGLNLPLPTAQRRARVEIARREYEAAQLRRRDRELAIDAELQVLLAQLDRMRRQLLQHRDSLLPLAEQTYSTTQSEYSVAKGNFLDVLEAERLLLRTRMRYLQLAREYQLTLIDLERAVAAPLATGESR